MKFIPMIALAALACVGSEAAAGGAPTSSPAPTGPVTLQDIDFQIKITKDAIEKYKERAFLFDKKAQSLMPHDFLGYREAESLSQQCQTIADDLTQHLQQLEEQRKTIEQHPSGHAPTTSERL